MYAYVPCYNECEQHLYLHSCFLQHPGVFFGAFIAPIFLILLFNVIVFIMVIRIVIKTTKEKLRRANESFKPKTALRLVASLSGIMFLFGITWLFAALTFTIPGSDAVRYTFQALFMVAATFQGFLLFIFFCILDQKALDAWREMIVLCIKISLPRNNKCDSNHSSSTSKKTDTFTLDRDTKYSFSDLKNDFDELTANDDRKDSTPLNSDMTVTSATVNDASTVTVGAYKARIFFKVVENDS